MPREGEGEEGVCMHERKLVVATKVRGLCGCKRLTKIEFDMKADSYI